ncbi:MAG TPA: PAS domain S-box protein, partial [Blastocatellia bacterium]|nr:PAS domain S-box protein [Blastocatellia bacterium]
VLLVTALRYDDRGIVDGLDAGADDYLELDAPPGLLSRKVERLLQQAQERRSREVAEKATTDSERRFRLFAENAYELMAIVSKDGMVRLEGAGMGRLLGYRQGEMAGKNLFDFIHPEDVPVASNALARVVMSALACAEPAEVRFLHREQGWRWMEVTGSNFIDEPALGGVLINAHDISERKLTLEDLKRTLDLKEAIFQGSRDAIFISDSSSAFTIVNSAACELTGYSEAELLRMTIPDLHEAVDLDAFEKYHNRIMAGEPMVSEAQILRKDGSKIFAEFNNRRVLISGAPYMHTVARDITERKQAEEALRRSEERYRLSFERNVAGIFCSTIGGRMLECNDALVKLLGYDSRDELLQIPSTDLHFSSETRQGYLKTLLAEGALVGVEEFLRRKDGSGVELLGNLALIGNGPDGEPVIYGTLVDISARKQAEEQLKEFAAKLEESNEELARFAYIASHDLQEPLRKVQSFAERLNAKYGDRLEAEGQDYLERMVGAARRMQVLIKDLLQLSRVTTKGAAFVRTDLGQVLREVVSDLEIQIEQAGATVDLAYLPAIEADQTQMRQLFQNIIGNALKFRRQGVAPNVRVKCAVGCGEGNGHAPESSADVCRISIEDNGIGFDKKHADRIFSPFQRLHGRGEYEGTGIGLAVCKRIIERHSGHIAAESAPGAGSTFIVTLPVRQNPQTTPQ